MFSLLCCVKKDSLKTKIEKDPDFINNPRMKNSLKTLIEKYPDGVSDSDIAKFLMCDIEDVDKIYHSAILKLRKKMKVDVNIS